MKDFSDKVAAITGAASGMGRTLSNVEIDPEEAVKGMEKLFITSPEKAAKAILRAVEQDKRRALVGPDAYALNLLAKLPPNLYQRLIARGAQRQAGPIV